MQIRIMYYSGDIITKHGFIIFPNINIWSKWSPKPVFEIFTLLQMHYRYLKSQFYDVENQCLNGMQLAAILLKIGIYRREFVKSIN